MKVTTRWLTEKVLLPLALVLTTALASFFIGPEILHRRDKKQAEETVRFVLVDEIALETASMMTAMWKEERAIDELFRARRINQRSDFRRRLKEVCGHETTTNPRMPILSFIDESWVHAAQSDYYERFGNHQTWAIRQKIRLAFLFPNNTDVQLMFQQVENGMGASDGRLSARRRAFETVLAEREKAFEVFLEDVKAKRVSDDTAHRWPDLSDATDNTDSIVRTQRDTLFVGTETSQQQLFQMIETAPITKSLAMSLARRN